MLHEMIRNIVATLFRMVALKIATWVKISYFASGKNRASLSILPLSLTGVHTKNSYDVNKKLNSQNSKEHWLYL